ncbi:hypothetical protein CVT25_010175 [Psilocybe cyanescens]|uniref:Uncharacterized protein n=1 Tax=Psilocybe cyanescens TaxID=93625 RepID=A0A409X2U4_PSICY|nr:hypothetical protein CVT25_010175 [Psilocybe cyanescens]
MCRTDVPQNQAGRPPSPPFTYETATVKVKAAQDLWNTRYTAESVWRNRDKFFTGHEAIVAFLTDKWNIENGYRLRKELLSFTDNKIAIQFWYEYHETSGQWCRTYDLEDWTFADNGLMKKRQMSADDVKITQEEKWFKDGVDVNR